MATLCVTGELVAKLCDKSTSIAYSAQVQFRGKVTRANSKYMLEVTILSTFAENSLLHWFVFFLVCVQPSKSGLLIHVLVGTYVTCILTPIRSFHASLVGVHTRLIVKYALDLTVSKGNLIDSRTLWSQREGLSCALVVQQPYRGSKQSG